MLARREFWSAGRRSHLWTGKRKRARLYQSRRRLAGLMGRWFAHGARATAFFEVADLHENAPRCPRPLHLDLSGATAPHGDGDCRHGGEGRIVQSCEGFCDFLGGSRSRADDGRLDLRHRQAQMCTQGRAPTHHHDPANRLHVGQALRTDIREQVWRPYSDCDPHAASVTRTPAVTTLQTVSDAQP